MIEILKDSYWSKSQAFLLPLSGLSKSQRYPIESFLFWEDYSIEDFHLILKITYSNKQEFISYCRKILFPILDKNGYLIESFDGDNESIFILDLSEWALDIEMFLKGKYSKMSKDAKEIIKEYHYFHQNGKLLIPPEIHAALNPTQEYDAYGKVSAIEYVSDNYGIDLAVLNKVGELASLYNEEKERLTDFKIKVL